MNKLPVVSIKGDLPGHPFRGNQYTDGWGDSEHLQEEGQGLAEAECSKKEYA